MHHYFPRDPDLRNLLSIIETISFHLPLLFFSTRKQNNSKKIKLHRALKLYFLHFSDTQVLERPPRSLRRRSCEVDSTRFWRRLDMLHDSLLSRIQTLLKIKFSSNLYNFLNFLILDTYPTGKSIFL